MKKFYNYTFQLVCVYILVLTLFSIFNFNITKTNYNKKTYNVNSQKVLDSTLLAQNLGEDAKTEESINTEETIEEVKEEQVNQVYSQPERVETPNYVDTSGYGVLAHETINMSHYGHDCIGCGSGYVSSGYYVGDGRIYYSDPTFGSVRIVAADYKYPEGTIIRLSYNGASFPAIVLDRGGAIGDHGRYQIDLLASSEYQANQLGSVFGVSLEVLRYGY